ncbi:nucleotidyltransferase domain-containing protein [Weissella confusa]|uniref:nucleotidyltransferase family protein n=1 Tax=Weissella confusa TaxID=1583 RepID=UPI0018A29FCD|nr:nucleotidyltransferase domain-containing protein [Weissella confusa]MBF7055189.1 nucleotidyltransferase domain-containing protein [Weissella confusa]
MIYETKQIAELIHPILDKYNIQKVVLFGSYAKGEASDKSDVDLLYAREKSDVKGLLTREQFREDLEFALGKRVDIMPIEDLEVAYNKEFRHDIIEGIQSHTEVLVDKR